MHLSTYKEKMTSLGTLISQLKLQSKKKRAFIMPKKRLLILVAIRLILLIIKQNI